MTPKWLIKSQSSFLDSEEWNNMEEVAQSFQNDDQMGASYAMNLGFRILILQDSGVVWAGGVVWGVVACKL